jgi:SAM-dependent methyltransferase
MLKDAAIYKGLRRLIKRPSELERRFTDIYRRNGFNGRESVSGPGSDLSATAAVREALPALLKSIGARTLLDAPCGDFFWMKEARLDLDRYIGADIVAAIIAENSRIHADAKREFRVLDITSDALPNVDVILCRDCLVHLPYAAILSAVQNFKRSGSKYLLTTTFTARSENHDIPAGSWRPLNLQAAPFNFPPPERLIDERCTEDGGQYPDKSMGLWKIEMLSPAFFSQ